MTVKEFELNFRRLYLPLGMYAMRIVDDVNDAEDLVQDTFVKIWESISSGLEVKYFDALMYRSVRNQCISFLRSKKETMDISDLTDSLPEISDEIIETSVRDAQIWKAIDKLPEKCREVFLMSKRDGLSNSEIAEELNISIKTVKNQLTKAFCRLRESLIPRYKPFFLPFL